MRKLSAAAAIAAIIAGVAQAGDLAAETAIEFEAASGETVAAYSGALTVPENRARPDSREITLRYVRFPATGDQQGAPIVYLAGGPGGSGIATATGRRFALFMAMRAFGDVIALDQRGTGKSDDTPRCQSDVVIPSDRATPPFEALSMLRASVEQCNAFWISEGVDPAGYTTVESARDLDALRAHLGADKLTLWGISYGTHLALAAVKEMGPRIDKLVLASAEGLDQTVKLPSRTDAYFDRLQDALSADKVLREAYPDIKALMRRVHEKLTAEPVMLALPTEHGAADFLLTREVMQSAASVMIADPDRAMMLLQIYAAVDAGVYDPVTALLARFITPGEPLSWRVMPLAMDVASGVGEERLAQIEREAETSLVGDLLNFPMPQLRGSLGGLDLGDDFRTPPVADIPTLLLTGTLDGRTYPDSQREAVSGLSNLTVVRVVNAGHNLFMASPAVTEAIQRFMRGEAGPDRDILTPPPMAPGP
ncbi:MAG: alpha/beta fold hydrolase [Hyphococcus sp.]